MRALHSFVQRWLPSTAGLSVLSALAAAQAPIVLVGQVLEDPMMNPIATVTSIQRIATTSDGYTLVLVDTNAPSSTDFLLWDGMEVVLREGDTLTIGPGTANIGVIESFDLTDAHDLAYMVRLVGVPSAENEGIFLNGTLLLQKGSDASVAGLPAGSIFTDLDEIEMVANGASEVEILAWSRVNDSGATLDVMLRINATTAGVVNSITSVLTEGDIFDTTADPVCPNGVHPIRQTNSAPNRFAINASGEAIISTRLDLTTDDFIVLKGGAIAAREGCPAPPSTTANWSNITSSEVDINDAGDWVLTGTLNSSSSSNLLIERSGAVFMRKGQTFPAIGGSITNFGNAPVFIAEDSDPIWYCEWNDTDPDLGEAIFKGLLPLVQAGQTTLDGVEVDVIRDAATSFAVSPLGDVVAFHAILEDGSEGVWKLGAGQPDIITEGIACGNAGTLTHVGGTAILGDGFTLRMDAGQGNGVLPILFFANKWIGAPAAYDPTMDCGFNWTFGNILLSVAPPNPVDFSPFVPPPVTLWASGMPVDFFVDLTLPQDPAGLVGLTFVWQGVFLDFSGVAPPGEKFRLTNAVTTTFGSL